MKTAITIPDELFCEAERSAPAVGGDADRIDEEVADFYEK